MDLYSKAKAHELRNICFNITNKNKEEVISPDHISLKKKTTNN